MQEGHVTKGLSRDSASMSRIIIFSQKDLCTEFLWKPSITPTLFVIAFFSLSRRALVPGNSLGKPNNQKLQKQHNTPNMANPSHQAPTQRGSLGVSDV